MRSSVLLLLALSSLLPYRKRRCSGYCDCRTLCGNVTELVWTRVASSLRYGSNRIGQHRVHQGLQSVFCYKYSLNTSFLVSVIFHDLLFPACDYFLWGYLISKFFVSKPGTTKGLKQRIKKEIAAIVEQTTRRVMESLGGILEEC